jgi:hypothetical protein
MDALIAIGAALVGFALGYRFRGWYARSRGQGHPGPPGAGI